MKTKSNQQSMIRKEMQIICPHCRETFSLEKALPEEFLLEFRDSMEKQWQGDWEKKIDQEKQTLEKSYWLRYQKEKEKLDQEFKKQLELKDQLTSELQAAKQKEIEMKRLLDHKIEAATREARVKTTQELAYGYDLKEREYRKQLDDHKKLILELKRKNEQGSIQLQGQVQEFAIEEMLKKAFPQDEVSRTKTGGKGADIIHNVLTPLGKCCGKIIYESKRTKHFATKWLTKIRQDQRQEGADIALLVSQTLPPQVRSFSEIDGVWVCGYSDCIALVVFCRQMLLRIHQEKSNNINLQDKRELIYRYFTSARFKQGVEMFLRLIDQQKHDFEKEKQMINTLWQTRYQKMVHLQELLVDSFGTIHAITAGDQEKWKEFKAGSPQIL